MSKFQNSVILRNFKFYVNLIYILKFWNNIFFKSMIWLCALFLSQYQNDFLLCFYMHIYSISRFYFRPEVRSQLFLTKGWVQVIKFWLPFLKTIVLCGAFKAAMSFLKTKNLFLRLDLKLGSTELITKAITSYVWFLLLKLKCLENSD